MKNLQRLFDTAIPCHCLQCGMLICIAPSRNGVQCKYDLDDKSNPTFTPHKCPGAEIKKQLHQKIKGIKIKVREQSVEKRVS